MVDQLHASDHDLLIRLDQKLDSHIEEVRTSNLVLSGNDKDHETRIRLLEKSNDELKGTIRGLRWVGAIIGIIAAVADPVILWILRHK